MTFDDVRTSLGLLAAKLETDCGRSLFEEITVDEPAGAESELDFVKLINWSYVLINEAGQVPLKFVGSLIRVSGPEQFAAISATRQAVLNLRTALAHNLPSSDAGNLHKARQAKIWLDQNGGQPRGWARCCEKLADQVTEMLRGYLSAWADATTESTDKSQNVSRLLAVVDGTWEPHQFDAMVSTAAAELGLSGLNVVAFRQSRLEAWRGLTDCFDDRESAERWVSVAIRNELASLFERR